MAKLSPDVKRYIVSRLACFDTVAEVRASLKEEFGLERRSGELETFHRDRIGAHLERDLRAPRVIREASREGTR